MSSVGGGLVVQWKWVMRLIGNGSSGWHTGGAVRLWGRWLLQKKMFASVMDFNLSLGASMAKPVSVECSEDEFLLRSRQLLLRFR